MILKRRLESLKLYKEKLLKDIQIYDCDSYRNNENVLEYLSHVNEAIAFIEEYSKELNSFLQETVLTYNFYQQVFKQRDVDFYCLLDTLQNKYPQLEKTPQ